MDQILVVLSSTVGSFSLTKPNQGVSFLNNAEPRPLAMNSLKSIKPRGGH
jgi:hypothetical protein